ncbi:GNAT family N-acetyltransferase [Oceanicola sp. S124]|uniref:GNAT family N-acetyltransferase n=1 Tax=Oceanicola sp. S124 TaxID=1042378 RepID=UPI00025585D2|nr:GNAT family N-acetyltransferase [Oceanicola sp. S124]
MLRPGQAQDAPAVAACAEAAYARYVPLIGRKPAPMLADFPAQIAAGQVTVWDEDGIHAYMVAFPLEGAFFLESIAVAPEAAGRGLGTRLMQHFEATARARGFERVTLYTNARMVENLRIYAHLGYEETARRSEGGFDRVWFEKRV